MKTDFSFYRYSDFKYITKMTAKNHTEIMTLLNTMNSSLDELKNTIVDLKNENAEFKKQLIVKGPKEVSEIDLLNKQLEDLNNNTKIKPDAKAKKIEKLEKKIEKIQKKEEPKAEEQVNLKKISAKLMTTLKEKMGDDFVESGKGVPKNTTTSDMFKAYVNAMTPDQYASVNPEVHMENFKSNNPKATIQHGGAVEVLTLDQLAKLQDELVHTDTVGEYKTSDGRLVTGPQRDEDAEDLNTGEFDGEEFDVDKHTQRVYDVEEGTFLGYWRVKGGLI